MKEHSFQFSVRSFQFAVGSLQFSVYSLQSVKMVKQSMPSLLIWVFLFISTIAFAQPTSVNVSILIPPPYSPYLQDYLQYEHKMVVQLQNLTNQTLSVKLIGSIEGDNGILLQTNENYLPTSPITIQPNGFFRIPASIRSRGFFDPDNLDFTGPENLKTQILKDGILPEGNYTICIQALDYQTDAPLSDEAPAGCTLLPITYPTPVQLFAPECENNVAENLPMFQWSLPGGHTGTAAIQYDLYIIEWLQGANPQDLVQLAVDYNAGNAIVRRNLFVPTYQYMVADPKLKEGATYLWVVKVNDRMNKILFENNGLSEVCSFTYRSGDINNDRILPEMAGPREYEIQQTRTQISGQMKYKFPGDGFGFGGMQQRNIQIETEEMPYIIANDALGNLAVLNDMVYALADHNYIDAFPVSDAGSNPLANIDIKLIESWVIMDCDVTYYPLNRTVHKEFFILPDEYGTPGGFGGGTTIGVTVDGLTNGSAGNILALDTIDGTNISYSRTLAVDRTDNSGNYMFRFTQSTPGLRFIDYPGYATVYKKCEAVEGQAEEHEWVHPIDKRANPTDIYNDQSGLAQIVENPINVNGIAMPENAVMRMGTPARPPGQMGYDSVVINGGSLMKVLRMEIASPFYYTPDLIFWTSPGDTVTLPDQVSYVKSVDLDLTLNGGRWQTYQNYQAVVEGAAVPGVNVVFSRKIDGLPQAIPIEEGQALRDNEGEANDNWQEQNVYANQIELVGFEQEGLYDSVSVMQSDGDGFMRYTRLVAGHPYYLVGSTPEDGGYNYNVPFQHREYEVFPIQGCVMNLEAKFNSFCEHKPIFLSETITAYPNIPKVFGRVTHATNDETESLPDVAVRLRRYENGVFKPPYITYTDENGQYRFDNVPVDPNGNQEYLWRLFFGINGYVDTTRPDEHDNTPEDDLYPMRPGNQWDVPTVEMDPMGQLTGYIRNEDGEMIHALVRLADGPHLQTSMVSFPMGIPDFCGDVNNFGDAINESTQISGMWNMGEVNISNAIQQTQAAYFNLPARSGNHLPLVIIPLPEQYFQDTCYVDVDELPNGQFQLLGHITVKEKLHRISISVKRPDGSSAQARVYIDERVRETNDLGFTAFRFASPETSYHVRIDPDSPTLVPIDTVMDIPISKTYLQHTFHLREGKKIKVRAIVDYSGYQQQPANPVPIAGAVVQTLLTSSQNGNSYISCITGADGVCTLEGVPASPTQAEISVWKEDDDKLYIGTTVMVNVNRPLNPPKDIALKMMSGVTIPDVWGFPTAITDMEIKPGSGGKMDTMFAGILTELPSNNRFETADDEVQIPYPKIKFAATGERDESGRKILQPTSTTGISLHQNSVSTILFDEFNVTLSPKRDLVYNTQPYLYLKKIEGNRAKITGVVETELSSFNFSYEYTGKFYLGKTPTEYNIDVFQSGLTIPYGIYMAGALQIVGQDPEPGPSDFYLMDIGPGNKPRSHTYDVFGFVATSDSSRSFVTPNAFYIHTILHTNLQNVIPSDLELSVGKIVVTKEEVQTLDNGFRLLDFRLGTYWRYYSTTPYRYDYNLGAITASHGFINTGQIDVTVRDPIIKPEHLFMNEIDGVDQLTLAGIKDFNVEDGVNISLSKDDSTDGWILNVQKRDANNNVIPDAIVAKLTELPPPLKMHEVINIYAIELSSEATNMDLDLSGKIRPYDICDFTVLGITTGPNFFMLEGRAELGRNGVRVHNLPPSMMQVLYKGPKQALTGDITSEYAGNLRTAGDVDFVFDYSDATTTRQHFSQQKYVTTGVFTVNDKDGDYNFTLKGILELDYDAVRIHVITEDLDIDHLEYAHVDQSIVLGNNKHMLVRSGIQNASQYKWQHLTFDANMVGFTGVQPNQSPMTFIVDGPVSANNEEVAIDGIDLGFAQINITYNFASQSFTGEMDVDFSPSRVSLGPVSVQAISADILIDPNGFLFAASIYGYVLELFDASFGFLIGSHTAIPPAFVNTVLQHSVRQELPEAFADGSIAGFYITGNVYLLNEEMPAVDLGLFKIEGSVEVGIDAQFYMNFESGDASFGFAALVYADAMASVTIYGVCPDPVISVEASLQLLLQGVVEQQGGDWVVEGKGCGSLSFEISVCGIGEPVGGYAELTVSSADGISADAGFGECVDLD